MAMLAHDAPAEVIEAHVAGLLNSYAVHGSAAFSRIAMLVETLWKQRAPAGIPAFLEACEHYTAPLPDDMVFKGQFREREERTDMAELRLFARSGEVLQPHDGARMFRHGAKGLAIMLTRSSGAQRSAQWGEFFIWRALRQLDMSMLLLGDRQNLIFQRGFGGFYGRLREGLDWIEAQAEPYDFAFFVGNSASGFPALQFAATTRIANVLTYSAGTHHPPEETRVALMRDRMDSRIPGRPLDVRPMFAGWQGAAHLHYPARHPVDILHATHLADIPGVRLVPYDTDFHPLFAVTPTEAFLEHLSALHQDPNARRMN
ncbi:MAG: hypothetical protein JJU18_09590 [Oceanicaulis sp.]|nr:hypothetical protein [Oceanicaulis sp.]